jgi:hypothetical protein
MEISKNIFTLIITTRVGDIKVGDVCQHPNNGWVYIISDRHRTYAMDNQYIPVDVHLVDSNEYENGDYVVEFGASVFGPVEQSDRISLEDCRKIVATSDKELGLPLLPQSFLEDISTISRNQSKIILDTIKVYNNGSGWKYALLPSEWNDSVETKQIPYVIDGYVTYTIPPTHFDLKTLKEAYREFAFSEDKPYNEADLENKFNKFLIEQINL